MELLFFILQHKIKIKGHETLTHTFTKRTEGKTIQNDNNDHSNNDNNDNNNNNNNNNNSNKNNNNNESNNNNNNNNKLIDQEILG